VNELYRNVLRPIGKRAKEIIDKDSLNFLSYPEKEMFLCILPEMSGEEENYIASSTNNFLVAIFPMGEEFSEKVKASKDILARLERRHSKIVLYDDEMKRFPYYSFSKLMEFREHLIYLLHWAYVQKPEIFHGRNAVGMSYSKIKYEPVETMENVRRSPWYAVGREEIFSFSKFETGHKVNPDLNEIFVVSFKDD
jgi:hypothetical protein